jgi:glycosyltransferase involved in cell wall biosynthesis
MNEQVSVIVRAYNAEKYIENALLSILNNTYQGPVEIVVCYDLGSKDRTLDVIKKVTENYQEKNRVIKLIMHEHTTPFRALLNYGLPNATGRYIAILDYDNLYPSNYINQMLTKALNTQKDFLFANIIYFDDHKKKVLGRLRIPKKPCNILDLIKRNYIDASAIFLERRCLSLILDKLNKLSHRVYDNVFEDWLIALIGIKHCQCFFCDDCYVFYRVHSTNLTGINVKDYRTKILTTMRSIVTSLAFYEIEKENLNLNEIQTLEIELIKKLIYMSKIFGEGIDKSIILGKLSRLIDFITSP